MPQRDQLFEMAQHTSDVLLGRKYKRGKQPHRLGAAELLERYDLSGFAGTKSPGQLSGRCGSALRLSGRWRPSRRMSAARRALLRAGLSDASGRVRRRLPHNPPEHKTALLVTHDISEAVGISDRVIVLTHRPAVVRAIHELQRILGANTIERRNNAGLSTIDKIWKELDVNV